MISLSEAPAALSSDHLTLYYSRDVLLDNSPVLVFYGPSTTGNVTHNSSRVQAHIYSLAGFQSFPRLTIAPSSPLYAAVNHLPAEQQGDEVSRGLAVSLLTYFASVSKEIKTILRGRVAAQRSNRAAPMMFDEMHAGDLAASMEHVEDSAGTAEFVMSALSKRVLSWVDMNVVLPSGTIQRVNATDGQDLIPQFDNTGLPLYHYGKYSTIVESLGSPAFLPTSKLQRAPSRPTAHSKSKVLSKDQKISLRRELCELVDTENNYIGKIKDLVDPVATDFRPHDGSRAVDALFPESLSRILLVNEAFYSDLHSILDETENEAIRDIEGNSASGNDLGSPVTQGRRRDPTGVTHVAKALLRWFPKFMEPYQEYLRVSADFPFIIGRIAEEPFSIAAIHLQDFGEQRLRSALIEPVQRLPRYSLLIDNVISLLPTSHIALSSLLKAKDMITDICALDESTTKHATRSTRILRDLVDDWPVSLSPRGRLVAAVDTVELDPPYETKVQVSTGLLLLFTDTVVVLQKYGETPLSARGVVAEIDRSTTSANIFPSSRVSSDKSLVFLEAFDLFDLSFSESEDGRLTRMAILGETAPILSSASTASRHSTKVYSLLGPYEGKAARFTEEVVKARTEGRFSEAIRDGGKWAVRSISPSDESLGVLVALSEEGPEDDLPSSHNLCQIHLSIAGSKDPSSILKQGRCINIAACVTAVTTTGAGLFQLDFEATDGTRFSDTCPAEGLTDVLLSRLGDLVRLQERSQKSGSTQSHILYDEGILRVIPLSNQQDDTHSRSLRPLSPIKIISNLLSGSSTSQPHTPSKHRHNISVMKNIPLIPPPVPSKSMVDNRRAPDKDQLNNTVDVKRSTTEAYKNPLALSEDTFVAYVVALRSRSGNVVGRVLRSRATADELLVNELYNILLEDPNKLQAAAEVSVDILFAAFEMFLKRAWKERMGPLLPASTLQTLQSAFDTGKPVLFAQQVKMSLEDMTPQNQRAFTSTVNLLSELLDASGNDGDRGALMASFAEALVFEGNPHDYIMLLDRLVDDYDALLGETPIAINNGNIDAATGSLTRTRSFNTGSISSNASSLRKRFGFSTLTRENSRNEPESKVASIWRTLSKNARSPGEGQSEQANLSKSPGGSLGRSRSTDMDKRMLPPLRPVSRDRPTTSGSTSQEESRSRPGSSHLNTSALSSIGEDTPTKPIILPKKKRRSSLSDLKSIYQPDPATAWSPLQPRKLATFQDTNGKVRTPLKTPSTMKQSPTQHISRQSPQSSSLPRRFGSPQRKENSPLRETSPRKASSPSMPRTPSAKAAVKHKSEEVVITSFSPQKRQTSRSGIPAPKGGLSERPWPPNGNNTPPKKSATVSQKLRMQSPQKIRERLSQEQRTLTISDDSFQAEMTKIGEEMATYKLQRSPTKPRSTVPASRSTQSTPTLESLSSQLDALSANLTRFTETQKASLSSISSDVESSLLVSEKKARKLDELYREANAENEALYERFNHELGKILGKVRKEEGVEEMRSKLKETQNEVMKLKRENAKLKREAVGLRSMMRGD